MVVSSIAISTNEIENFIGTLDYTDRMLFSAWLLARTKNETHYLLSELDILYLETVFLQTPANKPIQTVQKKDTMRLERQLLMRETQRPQFMRRTFQILSRSND